MSKCWWGRRYINVQRTRSIRRVRNERKLTMPPTAIQPLGRTGLREDNTEVVTNFEKVISRRWGTVSNAFSYSTNHKNNNLNFANASKRKLQICLLLCCIMWVWRGQGGLKIFQQEAKSYKINTCFGDYQMLILLPSRMVEIMSNVVFARIERQ